MLYNTAGEVTAQWLATMAASHWRARQAFTPRTYGHNSLISGLIQSVFADRVDSGAADPASRSPICITEESTIRASLLKSPWSDLWFPLIVSDTVPLFKAALWSMTVQLARGGGQRARYFTVCMDCFLAGVHKGRCLSQQHSAHIGQQHDWQSKCWQ